VCQKCAIPRCQRGRTKRIRKSASQPFCVPCHVIASFDIAPANSISCRSAAAEPCNAADRMCCMLKQPSAGTSPTFRATSNHTLTEAYVVSQHKLGTGHVSLFSHSTDDVNFVERCCATTSFQDM